MLDKFIYREGLLGPQKRSAFFQKNQSKKRYFIFKNMYKLQKISLKACSGFFFNLYHIMLQDPVNNIYTARYEVPSLCV